MVHMEKAEGTIYRDELMSKIIQICSQNNYQVCILTLYQWFSQSVVQSLCDSVTQWFSQSVVMSLSGSVTQLLEDSPIQ